MTTKDAPSTGFANYSRRTWSEEECRTMLNAALLYLAHKEGGTLLIPVKEMLDLCTAAPGGVAMAISDDDSILTITRMKHQ